MTIAEPETATDQHRHDPRTCKLVPCVLYMRLSDARNENESFSLREQTLRDHAARLGWCVARVVIENDEIGGDGSGRSKSASAFKRSRVRNDDGTWKKHDDGRYVMRVWRPGFRSILGDLTAGRAKAVLTEDLDRTLRDQVDAQDFIEVIGGCGGYADSLSGSLKFTKGGTDAEVMQCEILVSVARKSSADTARRVSDGRKRKATKNEFGGGRRPYGFGVQRVDSHGDPKVKDDGRPDLDYTAIVPAERDEIRAWADQVLAGVPLRSIARDLISRDVPTGTGTRRWVSQTVRDILLRPRNAGHVVHRSQADRERSRNATDPADKLPTHYTDKEFVGKLPGDPILPDDVWRAVVARLTDPASTVTWTTRTGTQRTSARGTNVGRAPTYLGTGLYLCHCGQPVSVLAGTKKAPRYNCKVTGPGHVARNVAKVDERVCNVIIQMMSRVDAAPALDVPDDDTRIDANALRAEIKVLKERRKALIKDELDGLIDRQERDFGLNRLKGKVADIDAVLTASTAVDPAGSLDKAAAESGDDPDARVAAVRVEWEALSLGLKRKIIADRLTVTILPTRLGSRFDPASVRIEPASH